MALISAILDNFSVVHQALRYFWASAKFPAIYYVADFVIMGQFPWKCNQWHGCAQNSEIDMHVWQFCRLLANYSLFFSSSYKTDVGEEFVISWE